MHSNEEMINKVKEQFSKDFGCSILDLNRDESIIQEIKLKEGRRILDSEGCFFKAISFQDKLIISASKEILPWCNEKFKNAKGTWIAEYYILRSIDKKLNEYEHKIADVHEYFLPDVSLEETKPLFNIKWYEKDEILQFRDDDRFNEAFAFNKNYPDVLAVAAVDDKDNILGMAGASEDSKIMWQIGINVLEDEKGKGIASFIVQALKNEILNRGKVPFYGTVESHIISQKVALKSGFYPAFAEVKIRKIIKNDNN